MLHFAQLFVSLNHEKALGIRRTSTPTCLFSGAGGGGAAIWSRWLAGQTQGLDMMANRKMALLSQVGEQIAGSAVCTFSQSSLTPQRFGPSKAPMRQDLSDAIYACKRQVGHFASDVCVLWLVHGRPTIHDSEGGGGGPRHNSHAARMMPATSQDSRPAARVVPWDGRAPWAIGKVSAI